MSAGKKVLIKVLVAVAAIGGLGFLLTWSARTTGALPYTIERESLRHWTLALNRVSAPNEPVLVLQPSVELSSGLFNQIFKRAMESLSIPKSPGIPLVLQSELDRVAGQVPVETLVAAAREAGLESTPLQPRCLGRRRLSEPGATRQLYFVLFDAPAFGRFRDRLATLLGSSFDPAAQSPVLLVAVAESNLSHWLPLRADPQKDCVAPIEVGSKP